MAWQATVITPWKLISNCSISSVSAATQSKIKHMLLRVTAWRNSCEWRAQQGAPCSYYCAEICWMNYFIFIQIEFCKIFTIFFLLQNCFDVKLRIRKRYSITEVIFKSVLHPMKFQSIFIHFTWSCKYSAVINSGKSYHI